MPSIALLILALCNFYLTTWEEYHTGVLFLAYFNGPVEGILMITIFYFVTAFKGPEFWTQSFFELLNVNAPSFIPKILADLPLNYHFLVFSAVSLGANILQRYPPLHSRLISAP